MRLRGIHVHVGWRSDGDGEAGTGGGGNRRVKPTTGSAGGVSKLVIGGRADWLDMGRHAGLGRHLCGISRGT